MQTSSTDPWDEVERWTAYAEGRSRSGEGRRLVFFLFLTGVAAGASILAMRSESDSLVGIALVCTLAWCGYAVHEALESRRHSRTSPGAGVARSPSAAAPLPDAPAYGPNGGQVRRFLERVQRLGPGEWERVRLRPAPEGPEAGMDEMVRQKAVAEAIDRLAGAAAGGHEEATGWLRAVRTTLGEAARRGTVPFEPPYRALLAANEAANALVVRGGLPTEWFERLYQPFATVIPPETLDAR